MPIIRRWLNKNQLISTSFSPLILIWTPVSNNSILVHAEQAFTALHYNLFVRTHVDGFFHLYCLFSFMNDSMLISF
jgi:hypothetical protein